MKVVTTPLEGCLIIEPDVFGDDRGFFLETYQSERYKKNAGIDFDFVQDNHSRSSFGILRGLHFQKTKPQGKLVRVVTGEVFDVVVDIRKQSKTFGKWTGITINDSNKNSFGYLLVLLMDSKFYLNMLILSISAPITMILKMKELSTGMIQL